MNVNNTIFCGPSIEIAFGISHTCDFNKYIQLYVISAKTVNATHDTT